MSVRVTDCVVRVDVRELLHCDLEGVQAPEAAGAGEARGGAHTALVDAYATARLFMLPYVIYLCFLASPLTRIVSIYQVIGRIRFLRRRTAKKRRAVRRERRRAAAAEGV